VLLLKKNRGPQERRTALQILVARGVRGPEGATLASDGATLRLPPHAVLVVE
jgi:hypothetical protein